MFFLQILFLFVVLGVYYIIVIINVNCGWCLQEMECVEAALKTSIRKEMALKSSPQVLLEDLWALNPQNVVPGDDFFVDDLLDFSNEDNFVEDEQKQENAVVSVSTKQEQKEDENDTTGSPNFDAFGPIPDGELAVPVLTFVFR